MGKGSGSCDERAPVMVLEAPAQSSSPEISLDPVSSQFGPAAPIGDLLNDRCTAYMEANIPVNVIGSAAVDDWTQYGRNYAFRLLNRYGKENFNNEPTEVQWNKLHQDIDLLNNLDKIVKQTIRSWPKILRKQADHRERQFTQLSGRLLPPADG